jgi:phage baseplate assembly protein W
MATTRVLSREDGNLSSSIITTREKSYSDIDLLFAAKPNGEIYAKKDAAAVKQAIKTLIQTNYFEKPYLPFFGANIRSLLFELVDNDETNEVIDNIKNAVEVYEPRAIIVDIQASLRPDNNALDLTIEFQIVSTEETVVFTTVVSRLR